tara:strand:- start:605 stop:1090 length:486 start_codon:yes stop_codon:yes gene_type:complete
MSIYKPTSWGRTRRPKHLSSQCPPAKQTATTVTCTAAGDLADNLDSATVGRNGYSTENQRFLHIQIENDGTDDTLQIYAYNYAFGSWAQLYLPHGTRTQLDTGDGDDSSGQTTNDTYVKAQWTTINGKFMVTIPIHGIDRVAFVHDGSLADMVVRAACSTF